MMLDAGKGKFESFGVQPEKDAITVYAVRCGETKFAWFYNSTENAEPISFTTTQIPAKGKKLRWFNCETGQFGETNFSFTRENGIRIETIQLPIKGSIILIWK
jgi:hypothetical protein